MHSEDFFCLFDFTGNNCLCPKLSASPISRYNEAHPLSNSWLRSSFGQKTQDFVTLRLKSGTTCNPSLQKKCLQPTGLPACNLYHLRRHFASPPGPRVIASRQRKRVSQEGLRRGLIESGTMYGTGVTLMKHCRQIGPDPQSTTQVAIAFYSHRLRGANSAMTINLKFLTFRQMSVHRKDSQVKTYFAGFVRPGWELMQ